jgi:hypothetical protein
MITIQGCSRAAYDADVDAGIARFFAREHLIPVLAGSAEDAPAIILQGVTKPFLKLSLGDVSVRDFE